MLEQEREFYDGHLADLLKRYAGRFVLIKGLELVGDFDTMDDALEEGARRFGLSSFLVRRVQPSPDVIEIPSLSLGLLNANSARPAKLTDSNS
jgi:hypothetical protein